MSKQPFSSRRSTRWDILLLFGGALIALLAGMTFALPAAAPWRAVLWGVCAGGAALFLTGLGLYARTSARRSPGLTNAARRWATRGPWLITCVLVAIALNILPFPGRWRGLAGAGSLFALGGALYLGWDLARQGTPSAYRRAFQAHAEGDEAAALAALEEVERDRPDFEEAYLLRAQILRQKGDLVASQRAAERLIALQPGLYHGYAELGLTLLEMHRVPEALEALQRAATLAPHFATAYYNVGLAYREAGDSLQAAEALAHALRLGLDDPIAELTARYELWRALRAGGYAEAAQREWRRLRRQRGALRLWRADLAQRQRGAARRREEAWLAEIEKALAE